MKNKISFKDWLKEKNINMLKITKYMDWQTTERFAKRTYEEYLKQIN